MTYEVEEGVIVIRMEGQPALDDFLELLQRIMDDESAPRPILCLVDVRGAEGGPPRDEIDRVAYFFDRHAHVFARRRALLVASDFQYGVGHIAKVVEEGNGRELAIFRDEANAKQWLRTGKQLP